MRFSSKEIIDIAIGIEESGYQFYTECRKKFNDSSLKELFAFLAEEEMRHRELFEKMLGTLAEIEGLFTDEYFQYLNAIGNERVFREKKDIDKVLDRIKTPLDSLVYALQAEKDTILFYSELRDLYGKNSDTLSILNKLINEERKHVLLLMDLRGTILLADQ